MEGTPAELKAVVGADLVTLRTGDDLAAVRAIGEQFGLAATEGPDGAQLRVADVARFVPKLCARLTVPVHSVTVVPPSPSYWLVDSVWSVLASADTTDGALTVLDQMMPRRSGPPPHVHDRLHEYFYLLDGEIRFQLGTEPGTGLS
ncbi:MAG: hypothetical protein M3Z75_28265 [Actinomycetota bacterium]|nr:hypothetical protein [Actinomycetota bacterium]